ncbi:MAG: 7,8-didemethyl-8-hydroxy-5-deazariboflavin synthase subunit CofG [Pyrinomonadaceae bacterium]|nr:7,8-didemethyl-8-hydroxy-5-deazariboflavin synthase subunit CofG [Pyrinomonadaceae bacterium]
METTSHNCVTYSPSWTLIPTHYCRNTCGYCVFVKRTGQSAQLLAPDMAEREIERARAAGATELLIMSGEGVQRSSDIRRALRAYGFNSYIDYLARISRFALERDLLPHINIGNLTEDELRALRPFVPSMGMMLETTDEQLMRSSAHLRAPDKDPSRRLSTLTAAGRARVPFTTGLLIGIGESLRAREASLRAIADIQQTYGHIQEVIIQPFTPHASTLMSDCAPPRFEELRDAVQLAREILPAEVVVQIPPNIAPRFLELIKAGARDLGGISPDGDRINPAERWLAPAAYQSALARHAFTLKTRLAVHETWATPAWLSVETFQVAERVRQRLPIIQKRVTRELAGTTKRLAAHV